MHAQGWLVMLDSKASRIFPNCPLSLNFSELLPFLQKPRKTQKMK
jgi:hypothetical protein